MATPTANYGLIKDAPTQLYDVAVVNANLDAIDGLLKEHADTAANADTSLDSRLDILEGKAYSSALTPMCRITQTANQVIANATTRNWDMATATDSFETVPGMGAGKAQDRMIMKIGGWYILSFRTSWDNNATGWRGSFIGRQNADGSAAGPIIADEYRNPIAAAYNTSYILHSAPEKFLPDQWAYAMVHQTSGGNLSLLKTNNMFSWFQATWIAGL